MTDTSKEALERVADRLEVVGSATFTKQKAADLLRALAAERDALAARLVEVEAKHLGAERVCDILDNKRAAAEALHPVIVREALERAAVHFDDLAEDMHAGGDSLYWDAKDKAKAIRAIAASDDEINAIIERAREGKG